MKKDLRNKGVSKDLLQQVKDILEVVPQVRVDFENPAVDISKKHMVIERVFPKEIRNFLKILCDNNDFSLFDEVYEAWSELGKTPKGVQRAELVYVTAPNEAQLAGIRNFLAKEFQDEEMELDLKEDISLKSGFILRVGTKEYDWSEHGRIQQLKSAISKKVSGVSFSEENII